MNVVDELFLKLKKDTDASASHVRFHRPSETVWVEAQPRELFGVSEYEVVLGSQTTTITYEFTEVEIDDALVEEEELMETIYESIDS